MQLRFPVCGVIELRKASVADAPIIAATRRIVWEETYRGIYPDAMLDDYELEVQRQKEAARIVQPEYHCYLFMDEDACAGYFSFGPPNYGPYKDFSLCLNSLYIREGYKGMGLGRRAFRILHTYAVQQGIRKFYCGCNIHNPKAQSFYRHMGGMDGLAFSGHENRSEDIIHFEFYLGE